MNLLLSLPRAVRVLALAMTAMAAGACTPLNDAMVRPTVDVREPTTVRPPVMLAYAAPSSTAEPVRR